MKRRVGLRRTGFARRPRHRMSAAEEALWARLGAAPFAATFLSQMPVGRFAAGFGSYAAKVIVEIDGDGPGDAHARDAAFESAGYLVLRFREDEVIADMDAVMAQIGRAMAVWNG
jgi:very-short-patch-repair endonuclease